LNFYGLVSKLKKKVIFRSTKISPIHMERPQFVFESKTSKTVSCILNGFSDEETLCTSLNQYPTLEESDGTLLFQSNVSLFIYEGRWKTVTFGKLKIIRDFNRIYGIVRNSGTFIVKAIFKVNSKLELE